MRRLGADLVTKGQDKTLSSSVFAISFVFRSHVPQQQSHIFHCLPFACYIFAEVLSTAYHMPFNSYIHQGFGHLNYIPACPSYIFVLLFGSLHLVHFFFAFQFSQGFLVQSYCPPFMDAFFFLHIRMNTSCDLKKLSSKVDPLSWNSFYPSCQPPRRICPVNFLNNKFCSLEKPVIGAFLPDT